MQERGIDSLDSISYPPNAPLSARPDWRDPSGRAGTDVAALGAQVLDRWGSGCAILNCLYGVQLVFNEDMAAAFARAVNGWIAAEWLDRDPRLRASMVVPLQNVDYAVDEIERCAKDKRFVQILVLAMGEMPLGRRHYWPIFAAAERHGLPIGIHAGSAYRHPVTALGWPTYYVEDYTSQSQGFQSQTASLISEGVFAKFPALKVVLIESGVTWVPAFLWRFSKFWRGLRSEIPWVDRTPAEIFRDHFRLTIQPFDAPDAGRRDRARDRSPGLRRDAAVRQRLSALAVRRRRADAARLLRRVAPQDHGGQSARDVSDFVGSHLYDQILILDAHRKCLRHIRAFDQARAGLDRDGEIAHPHAARIAPGFAGTDIVFPLVPRAAQDLALARDAVLARLRGLRPGR